MKFTKTKKTIFRPTPYPCWIVYEKRVTYFMWIIPIKTQLIKLK